MTRWELKNGVSYIQRDASWGQALPLAYKPGSVQAGVRPCLLPKPHFHAIIAPWLVL
jgi:hypothetical protein